MTPRLFFTVFMLTKQDFTKLRTMLGEMLNDMKVELRDEMHAMEKRLVYRTDRRMDRLRDEIVSDVGSIIDEGILPYIPQSGPRVRLQPKRSA